MPINSGELDRKITIQKKVIERDEIGGEKPVWKTVSEPWAKVKFNPGGERFQAAQFIGKTPVQFLVRWSLKAKELTAEHRVLFEGRTFDVVDTSELGRREGIFIDATVHSETQMDNA